MVNKTIKAGVAALMLGLTAQVSAYDWSFENTLPVPVKVVVAGVGAGIMRRNVEGIDTSKGVIIPAKTTDFTSFRFGWPTEPGYPGICMEYVLIGKAPNLDQVSQIPKERIVLLDDAGYTRLSTEINTAVGSIGAAAGSVDIKGSAQYVEMATKVIGGLVGPAMALYGMVDNTCRNRHYMIALDESGKIVLFTRP